MICVLAAAVDIQTAFIHGNYKDWHVYSIIFGMFSLRFSSNENGIIPLHICLPGTRKVGFAMRMHICFS